MAEATGDQVASVAHAERAQPALSARVASVDILRGIVIALMALDHVRDFFHDQALVFDALDPERSYPLLYATRWITHLCAPTFVLLAGVSAFLQGARGKGRAELSRFLLLRGLWLVLMELTVVGFGWSFSFDFAFLQVIWAIGWSMVALAGLVWLPWRGVLAVGALILVGHNLLDPLAPAQFGALAPLWTALHEAGPILDGGELRGFFAYPLLPWIGIIALGYGLGPVFLLEAGRRRRTLLLLGSALVMAFPALRALDGYGDPDHWAAQATFGRTVMDFLDTTKYPPSLLFACMTIGPALLVLPVVERLKGRAAEPWATFGAVPFFVYVLHVYLAHGLAAALARSQGYGDVGVDDFFRGSEALAGWGVPLAVVYLIWLGVLALLYPACRWFAALKRRRRDWWLSYL
jgi:uncharacterized membrane protein